MSLEGAADGVLARVNKIKANVEMENKTCEDVCDMM